jgi:uncharacterized protein YaaR (DUF327 family)
MPDPTKKFDSAPGTESKKELLKKVGLLLNESKGDATDSVVARTKMNEAAAIIKELNDRFPGDKNTQNFAAALEELKKHEDQRPSDMNPKLSTALVQKLQESKIPEDKIKALNSVAAAQKMLSQKAAEETADQRKGQVEIEKALERKKIIAELVDTGLTTENAEAILVKGTHREWLKREQGKKLLRNLTIKTVSEYKDLLKKKADDATIQAFLMDKAKIRDAEPATVEQEFVKKIQSIYPELAKELPDKRVRELGLEKQETVTSIKEYIDGLSKEELAEIEKVFNDPNAPVVSHGDRPMGKNIPKNTVEVGDEIEKPSGGAPTMMPKADIDAKAAANFLYESGKKFGDGAQTIFVPKGAEYTEGFGVDSGNSKKLIYVEDGKIIINHHYPNKSIDTSATEITIELLKKLGKLKEEPWHGPFIKFLNEVDNLHYPPMGEEGLKNTYAKSICGLRNELPLNIIIDLFKKGVSPYEALDENIVCIPEHTDEAFTNKDGTVVRPETFVKAVTVGDLAKEKQSSIDKTFGNVAEHLKKMGENNIAVFNSKLGKTLLYQKYTCEPEAPGKKAKFYPNSEMPLGPEVAYNIGFDSYILQHILLKKDGSKETIGYFVSSPNGDIEEVASEMQHYDSNMLQMRGAMLLHIGKEPLNLAKNRDFLKIVDLNSTDAKDVPTLVERRTNSLLKYARRIGAGDMEKTFSTLREVLENSLGMIRQDIADIEKAIAEVETSDLDDTLKGEYLAAIKKQLGVTQTYQESYLAKNALVDSVPKKTDEFLGQLVTKSVMDQKLGNRTATTLTTTVDPDRSRYTPLVRSIALAENVTDAELEKIVGTGAEGKVTKEDIMEFLKTRIDTARAPLIERAARLGFDDPKIFDGESNAEVTKQLDAKEKTVFSTFKTQYKKLVTSGGTEDQIKEFGQKMETVLPGRFQELATEFGTTPPKAVTPGERLESLRNDPEAFKTELKEQKKNINVEMEALLERIKTFSSTNVEDFRILTTEYENRSNYEKWLWAGAAGAEPTVLEYKDVLQKMIDEDKAKKQLTPKAPEPVKTPEPTKEPEPVVVKKAEPVIVPPVVTPAAKQQPADIFEKEPPQPETNEWGAKLEDALTKALDAELKRWQTDGNFTGAKISVEGFKNGNKASFTLEAADAEPTGRFRVKGYLEKKGDDSAKLIIKAEDIDFLNSKGERTVGKNFLRGSPKKKLAASMVRSIFGQMKKILGGE